MNLSQARRDYDRIAEAIDYLRANVEQQPGLKELAAAMHMSPDHLQRVFRRWAGISPKRFLQHITLERAQGLLQESDSVLSVSQSVGLSGSGRLHDHFVSILAMTPGEVKKRGTGLSIEAGFADTPFGQVCLARTERGICHLTFCDNESGAFATIKKQWPNATLVQSDNMAKKLVSEIFNSTGPDRNFLLHLRGTNFQLQVWRALLQIPEGTVTHYGTIANAIGRPNAARAIGQAVGKNPVAYLIPCHRVIRASGAFGGYHWGLTRKQTLLTFEKLKQLDAS